MISEPTSGDCECDEWKMLTPHKLANELSGCYNHVMGKHIAKYLVELWLFVWTHFSFSSKENFKDHNFVEKALVLTSEHKKLIDHYE